MIHSRYTTHEDTWAERVSTMRVDFVDGDYNRLYFLLALSLCDAYDGHDYDRHEIILGILDGLKRGDELAISDGISLLEELG